jgi:hypothetical protein
MIIQEEDIHGAGAGLLMTATMNMEMTNKTRSVDGVAMKAVQVTREEEDHSIVIRILIEDSRAQVMVAQDMRQALASVE